MNITAFGILEVAALALAALASLRESSARAARQLAVLTSGVIALWSLIGLTVATWEGSVSGWQLPFPALVALVTFVAVSLSSLSDTRPSTFAIILALGATSVTAVWLTPGFAVWALLSLQALLVWWELRRDRPATARAFGVFHGVSLASLAVGLALGGESTVGFWAVALGLLIREGSLPFHHWFVRFTERAPMGLVVAFSAPQLGLLLHLRVLSPHLPPQASPYFGFLGLVTALFGAVLATSEPKLKRVIAYLIISQSGLVALGLESSSEIGQVGGLSAWLLVALTTAGLAMLCEALSARHMNSLSLTAPGGDFESTPILATSFLLIGLSLVGLPGTLGFVAEDLLVQGTLAENSLLGWGLIVVTAINAFTVMRCVLTLFVGPKSPGGRSDLWPREKLAMALVLISLALLGLVPSLLTCWFG